MTDEPLESRAGLYDQDAATAAELDAARHTWTDAGVVLTTGETVWVCDCGMPVADDRSRMLHDRWHRATDE